MAVYVSPSQLDTYLTCKRKWGFRYLDGIEAPPHRSAQVGTRVHEILEEWLRNATPPRLDEVMLIEGQEYHVGRIAMEAIPFLPPPGPHLSLEQKFVNKHWLGYKDVRYYAAPNHVVVMDHKTTSNFAWAKTAEDLSTDPQAIVYAKAEFDADPAVQIVDLAWTYTKTSKPYKAKPVRLRVLREYVDEVIRPYDHIAAEMLALRNGGYSAMQLEPDPQHCQKYGGCPYLNRCNLTPEDLMRGVMNQLGLMEKIAAAKAASEGNLPPALPEPMGASQAPPVLLAAPSAPPPLPAPAAAPAPPLPPAAAPALPVAPPALPVVASPPVEVWTRHPEDPTYEFNAKGELRKVAAPALPVAPPVAPTPVIPAAPPASPVVPAAPPVVPPAEVWYPHPKNPAYEFNEKGELREKAAAPVVLNPPEAPSTEKAAPTPVTQADADESKVGDEFDAMSADDLKAIAKLNAIEVKGLREKKLRVTVRAAMRAKAAPGIGAAPAAAPQIPTAPPAAPPAAPPTAHVKQPDLPHMQSTSGAYTQAMTEEFSQAQASTRKRPRFTVLVNTAPLKTQGLVMTLSEAFATAIKTVCEAHGVDDWRCAAHGGRPALLEAATLMVEGAEGWESSLDGSVILLRTGTDEGSLLHDLLLENALEAYGA